MDHHEKLAWSTRHLQALDREINDFIRQHPLVARCEQEGDSRRFRVIANEYPQLPSQWSLMVGDAIHNMRGALDHLIWALTEKAVASGGQRPNSTEALKIGYPASLRHDAYFGTGDNLGNGARKRQAGWIGDDALAVVDSTQPYLRGDDAHSHPLAVLVSYSNEDKHRNLIASAALASSIQFTIRSTPNTTGQFILTSVDYVRLGEWCFYSGADLGTAELGEGSSHGPGEVELIPDFTGTVVFRQRGPSAPITVESLLMLGESLVEQVVAPLDAILMR